LESSEDALSWQRRFQTDALELLVGGHDPPSVSSPYHTGSDS
jgi:hypothetical protein